MCPLHILLAMIDKQSIIAIVPLLQTAGYRNYTPSQPSYTWRWHMSATLHIFTEAHASNVIKADKQTLHSELVIETIYNTMLARLRTAAITHPDRPNDAHFFLLTGLLAIIYGETIGACDGPVLWALKDSLIKYGHDVDNFDPYNYRGLIGKIEDKAIENMQKMQPTIIIPNLPNHNDGPCEKFDLLTWEDEITKEQHWAQIIVIDYQARECQVQITLDPDYTTEEAEENLKKITTIGGFIPLHKLQPPRCYRG